MGGKKVVRVCHLELYLHLWFFSSGFTVSWLQMTRSTWSALWATTALRVLASPAPVLPAPSPTHRGLQLWRTALPVILANTAMIQVSDRSLIYVFVCFWDSGISPCVMNLYLPSQILRKIEILVYQLCWLCPSPILYQLGLLCPTAPVRSSMPVAWFCRKSKQMCVHCCKQPILPWLSSSFWSL